MTTGGATPTSVGDIHLLENYGVAATKTLCGIAVPRLLGSSRGDLHWGHVGHETCAECRKVQDARVAQLAGSQPALTLTLTIKAHPLSRTVRKSGGSPT